MLALLLSLLACTGTPVSSPAAASAGDVEVRLVGLEDAAPASACGPATAAVWFEGLPGARRPGHGLISWHDCGPQPALTVLPPGSTVVLRNDGPSPLQLRWSQPDGGPDLAALAVGGERRIALGTRGALTVESERGHATVVVAQAGGITDSQGRAALSGVPAGTYDLHVLHTTMGSRRATVSVPAGDRVVVELELPRQL